MSKNILPDDESQKRFTDEQTDKRIHQHLTNENDQITEEDISNIKTDVVLPEEENHEESEEEKMEKKHKIKDNEDSDIDTSWNILGS